MKRRKNSGYTLPELLIGSALFLTVMGVTSLSFQQAQRCFQISKERLPRRIRLQLAMEQLEAQIRGTSDVQNSGDAPGIPASPGMTRKISFSRIVTWNQSTQTVQGAIFFDPSHRQLLEESNYRDSDPVWQAIQNNQALEGDISDASFSVAQTPGGKYVGISLSAFWEDANHQTRAETIKSGVSPRAFVPARIDFAGRPFQWPVQDSTHPSAYSSPTSFSDFYGVCSPAAGQEWNCNYRVDPVTATALGSHLADVVHWFANGLDPQDPATWTDSSGGVQWSNPWISYGDAAVTELNNAAGQSGGNNGGGQLAFHYEVQGNFGSADSWVSPNDSENRHLDPLSLIPISSCCSSLSGDTKLWELQNVGQAFQGGGSRTQFETDLSQRASSDSGRSEQAWIPPDSDNLLEWWKP